MHDDKDELKQKSDFYVVDLQALRAECKDMTPLQELLHRRLCDAYFATGGVLPSNPVALVKISQLSPERFQLAWPFVSRHWTEAEDVLHNERMRIQVEQSLARVRAES